MKKLLTLAGMILLSGCAVASVSLSSVEPNSGRRVTAEISKFNFLGFTTLPQEDIEGQL